VAAMSLTGDEGSSGPMSFLGKERKRETLHGQKEVSFVSIIMFILRPDAALSLNGSVMINQSINQVVPILWRPADSNECRFGYHCQRWASDCYDLEMGGKNKLILYTKPWRPRPNPSKEAPGAGGVYSSMETMMLEGNSSSWWGCLCDVCFASKKSSERDFFILAGTHLAVKLLTLHKASN